MPLAVHNARHRTFPPAHVPARQVHRQSPRTAGSNSGTAPRGHRWLRERAPCGPAAARPHGPDAAERGRSHDRGRLHAAAPLCSRTVIIRQGETADTGFMVLVLVGDITVETITASRTEPVTITVLGPGSLIGEMALVDGGARSASCVASSDVKCAVLTREALEILIREEPRTAAKLMTAVAQRLAERLRESGHKLQIYSQLVQTMQEEINRLMPTPDTRPR
ncbi:MAG: cyclic nucleotide-binding domain-containing protein [Gammaproteobacteria bacterium]